MTDIVFKHALHEVVQGHKPLLGPLAENTHQTTLQVQIRHAQITKFRHAQSCRIQQLKHAAVALAASFAHVGLRQHFFHFITGQHFGQVLRQLGVVHQLRGIGLDDAFLHGKVKKSPQGGQTPRQRSLCSGVRAAMQGKERPPARRVAHPCCRRQKAPAEREKNSLDPGCRKERSAATSRAEPADDPAIKAEGRPKGREVRWRVLRILSCEHASRLRPREQVFYRWCGWIHARRRF